MAGGADDLAWALEIGCPMADAASQGVMASGVGDVR